MMSEITNEEGTPLESGVTVLDPVDHLETEVFLIPGTSHTDHGLSKQQMEFILALLSKEVPQTNRNKEIIITAELPKELGTLKCALYGPAMGDHAVQEDEVDYVVRKGRKCASRIHKKFKPRKTSKITGIAGWYPAVGQFVLFTAYGGPCAPKEPGDPTIQSMEVLATSRDFWAHHALAR